MDKRKGKSEESHISCAGHALPKAGPTLLTWAGKNAMGGNDSQEGISPAERGSFPIPPALFSVLVVSPKVLMKGFSIPLALISTKKKQFPRRF